MAQLQLPVSERNWSSLIDYLISRLLPMCESGLAYMRLVGDIWYALVFYQGRVSGRVCGLDDSPSLLRHAAPT